MTAAGKLTCFTAVAEHSPEAAASSQCGEGDLLFDNPDVGTAVRAGVI